MSVVGSSSDQLLRSKTPDSGAIDVETVREALSDVLESKYFHGSKQCSDLLRYIVEHSTNPEDASLKERIIGTQVFNRKPSYDTAEDPVVRVRAAEVRKRLAQYYQSFEHGSAPLHIELSPGSYRASFRVERATVEAPPKLAVAVESMASVAPAISVPIPQIALPARKSGFSFRLIAILAIFLIAGSASTYWFLTNRKSPQTLFWAPLTKVNQPVLVYLGTNVGYIFRSEFLDRYRAAHGMTNTGPEFVVDLPPNSTIHAEDIIPVENTFITTGDLAAIAQMLTLMDSWKKSYVLRSGRDLSFGDLRNHPAVLVGGFNNQWTLQVTNDLPFSFREGTRIVDRDHPGREWQTPPTKSANTDDYAIIARLLQSKTGGPIMVVAGIGEYGTQAAAEFVSSPEKMAEFLKTAPPGWQDKNFECILRVKVVQYAPVTVDVVDKAYW
jgi:hypothetical protein